MPTSENPKKVPNNDLPNSQFGGGLINADIVNAQRTTGDSSVTSKPLYAQSTDLQVFQYNVVTFDAKCQEIKREKSQAQYFSENLGNNVTLEMVAIPSGKFMMGSPKGEGHNSEKPQHQVAVPPFFMAKYPVTQAQWETIAALPKINRHLNPKPSYFKGANRPVEEVSWYDAVEFCLRLSQHTGKSYRLPSEAEWEYACRAGTTTPFYFGEKLTPKLARCKKNAVIALFNMFAGETAVVGSYLPNAFGLYDMHGNVWEWCLDDWHSNYEGAPTDGSPWFEGNNLHQKKGRAVLRGGSWGDSPEICRCAYRSLNKWAVRDYIFIYLGFRIVCEVERNI